ncbi:MAG: molybdenum ABC transporter ATP-binding protein [Nitrospinota bacterium]|nr:molybdenum ABC transporter ATP-binding protein [Nitrospinota bacterium]
MSTIRSRFKIQYAGFSLETDLNFPAEGVTVIFGRSGSGKTTLLRCLAGLEKSSAGFMKFGDAVWQDESKKLFLPVHRRPIGLVFQDARLFPHLTVRDNLLYGYRRTEPTRRQIELDQVVDLMNLQPLLDRRPQKLSGGEQQRVAIGRALLKSPRLLLMDEPLANLDAQHKQDILPFLIRLKREMRIPIVYVTHSLSEVVQLVDTLVLLENGKSVAAGPANEVLSRLDLAGKVGPSAVGSVLTATVAGHETEFGLTRVQYQDHSLYIPEQPLAVGSPLRLHLLAQDISIALGEPQAPTSILNRLPATVLEIGSMESKGSAVNLKLDVGEPILATITRKSLAHLNLKPGMQVYANVKAVKMVHEIEEY